MYVFQKKKLITYSYIHVCVLLLIIIFGHYKSLFSLGISKVKDFVREQ